MPSAVAWLMNRSRHSGSVSESKVTTLTPASRASLSASQIAVGSLAETTSASTPCWAAVLMNGTCASGVPVVGADLLDTAAELLDRLLATGSLVSK